MSLYKGANFLIQDKTSQEDLKDKLSREELRRIEMENDKKKKSTKLASTGKVLVGIAKKIEKM